MSGNTSIFIRSFRGRSRRSYIRIPTDSSEMICYSVQCLTAGLDLSHILMLLLLQCANLIQVSR